MRKEYLPRPSGFPGTNNPRRVYSAAPIEIDLARSSDQFRCLHIPEPNLIFGGGGSCSDPKTGLAVYGPYGAPRPEENRQIRVGIVGTTEAIDQIVELLQELSQPIEQNANVDCVLHPSFPGINSQDPFRVHLVTQPQWQKPLNKNEVCSLKDLENSSARMMQLQEMFGEEVRAISKLEYLPQAILCALPESITTVLGIDTASDDADRASDAESSPDANDRMSHRLFQKFRSGLKAECMGSLPTELIWDKSDLREKGSRDHATRAWNLSLALLKKAGVIPWRLANTAEDSCFIGISYYRASQRTSSNALSSFAHVLTELGEGFVVQGQAFECGSEENEDATPNSDEEHAMKLLARALAAFEKHVGFSPSKVTVHKANPYSEAERDGFENALSNVPNFGLMTISHSGIACIRPGRKPILRGTAIPFDEKTGLVATSGYVPFLRGDFGNGIPYPLAITENWGSITFGQAAEDLIRLTKLDLNSSDFCSEFPITLSRLTEIGEVLRVLGQKEVSSSDRYYV
jgi:hypothetical protein